ncbi:MAG: cytochrome c oxidase subunit II transmembrane domain-containing protein [Burkholderia sp.]|nr:cytochrome c oxidase subunit II transmembrane domain-containing protein [Burkholderia sp.]
MQSLFTKLVDKLPDLHMVTLVLCTMIFVSTFCVMFYSIFEHRKSKGKGVDNFHKSTIIEVIWTILPFIMIILMALPAIKTVLTV